MSHQAYDGENRRAPDRWKISREVSVADLVSVALAFAAMFAAFSNLDKRQAVADDRFTTSQAQQAATDRRQDEDSIRYQARIDGSLKDMNAKLDRLLERSGK